MKKEDLWIVILFLALVAGILLTIFLGGNRSKHGYGAHHNKLFPALYGYQLTGHSRLDRESR